MLTRRTVANLLGATALASIGQGRTGFVAGAFARTLQGGDAFLSRGEAETLVYLKKQEKFRAVATTALQKNAHSLTKLATWQHLQPRPGEITTKCYTTVIVR